MNLIFSNCKEFNERGTEIYKSANRLSILFRKLWFEIGLDHDY